MKTLNKNLFGNFQISNAEMRSINGGIIVDGQETSGRHGNGRKIADAIYLHSDGHTTFDWEYIE